MGLFDMFDGKKSRLAEAGDQLLENAARTTGEIFEKPVREKAMKTINGAADLITRSLEAVKSGQEIPDKPDENVSS